MCASCVIQEIKVVSVSEIENKRYQWLCGYISLALSAEAMPVSSALFMVLLIISNDDPNSARENIDGCFWV